MHSSFLDFLRSQSATVADDGLTVRFASPVPADATVIVPLAGDGLMTASGEDSADFLHNLLSNDIKNLAPTQARRACFNTPKGRMLASFLIWRAGDDIRLQLSADIQPMMQKKLSMYVLRSKVRLSDARDNVVLLGLAGPQVSALLQAAGLPALPAVLPLSGDANARAAAGLPVVECAGGQLIALDDQRALLALPLDTAAACWTALTTAGAVPAGTDSWDLGEIRAGVPRIVSGNQEAFVAQMVNFESLGGVSFKKGCYPGQEIVARVHYLGKVKRRMYRLALASSDLATLADIPTLASGIFSPAHGEEACGQLVNLASTADGGLELLAVLQDGTHTDDLHLGSIGGPRLQVCELPYSPV